MAKRGNGFNTRTCPDCGQEIIDVREEFTGATYPVDAIPVAGLVLSPPAERQRNALAERGEVHLPHVATCNAGQEQEAES